MNQLTVSPFYLLVACYDSATPAEYAAGMLLQLVEPTELKKEMYEAVDQAYNGLNASYGDYMKKVLLSVIKAEGDRLQAEILSQLAALESEMNRANSI
jgi:hypothetical protein